MKIRNYLIVMVFSILFWNSVYAEYWVWWIDNIDIVTREERWADDNILYEDRWHYKQLLEKAEEYEKFLEKLKEDDIEEYIEIKKKELINIQRNKHLEENYFEEIKINKIVEEFNEKNLWWSFMYHYEKDRIIVHHTASDWTKLKSKEDVKDYLKSVYQYHALTRWWWDIWYNFVIDKFWNIYEWREWWEWVVWAHAKWNNVSSIWISLIGNFNNEDPSEEQMDALIDLATELAKKYNINPYTNLDYHKESSEEPYISDHEHDSIVWHRDAWHTSCPWENLYDKLDYIKKEVSKWVKKSSIISSNTKSDVEKNISKSNNEITLVSSNANSKVERKVNNKQTFYIPWDSKRIEIKIDIEEFKWLCFSKDRAFDVTGCLYKDWLLTVDLSYNFSMASWKKYIYVESDKYLYVIKSTFVWQNDLDLFLKQRKENYTKSSWFTEATNLTQKVQYKVSKEEAKSYIEWNIRVLLYELSVDYNERSIDCKNLCKVTIDWFNFFDVDRLYVKDDGEDLYVELNWKSHKWNKVIIHNDYEVEFINYWRESYAWIAWNSFKWNIEIYKDHIKPIWKSKKKDFIVVNELSFYDYMNWIAEMNDQQWYEKIKAMALVIKDYVLFYYNKWNEHPSIPKEANYNAVDDPRIFQKYVWAWYERTAKLRSKALYETIDEIILYDWYIPILPYFNCSAWFMLSGKEKYWWTDTPYLSSKLDFVKCNDFNWHWVWLSGQWANYLAKKWISYKLILKYYYWMNVTKF